MGKIQIEGIELVFSEKQRQSIAEIEKTIRNNYELILIYLEKNKTIDISQDESNFNNTFNYIVNKIFNNDNMKQYLGKKEFLSALYIEALIREIKEIKKRFFSYYCKSK